MNDQGPLSSLLSIGVFVFLRLLHSSPDKDCPWLVRAVGVCLWFVSELLPSTSPPPAGAGVLQLLLSPGRCRTSLQESDLSWTVSPERQEDSLCVKLRGAVGSCHKGFPLLSSV